MKIKIIKKHPVGLAEGQVLTVDNNHGKRLIAEGYAVEAKASDKNIKPKVVTKKKVVAKKVNENKCKGCGDVDEPCKDCNDKK
tara:strand:+ start:301 stop:549 length:249 start_codon:yes stop_codon:yes gene_type:complete